MGRTSLRSNGIVIGELPCGKRNAITDVAGIRVGHCTVDFGQGELVPGKGPARTGVTVILPHGGDLWNERPSASSFVLNGCGVVTGSDWINESGALEGPVALTNSHSVGDVGNALIRWMCEKHKEIGKEEAYLPVVAECDDSFLNDINGFHVKDDHVRYAIETADEQVQQGAIGAGRGMSCYGYKGGIGTSSRLLPIADKTYAVGCLVNTNHGRAEQLLIKGAPAGRMLKCKDAVTSPEGSIVIVIATDAPLNSLQMARLCKRAAMGLSRTGSCAGDSSGDFILGFSTGRIVQRKPDVAVKALPELHNAHITKFFEAVIEVTEESILNSLWHADTVCGRDGNTVYGLPIEACLEVIAQFSVKE